MLDQVKNLLFFLIEKLKWVSSPLLKRESRVAMPKSYGLWSYPYCLSLSLPLKPHNTDMKKEWRAQPPHLPPVPVVPLLCTQR